MTGMARKPRVEDNLDAWVALEMLGDTQRRRGALSHSGKQCPHASQKKPRVETTWDRAGTATPRPDPLHERVISRCDDRAGKHVTVTVEVLRR
jgi:hypothetical protein